MTIPRSEIKIIVGSLEIRDWARYQIESDILQDTDAFSFTAHNNDGWLAGQINPLDEVKVIVDGSIQMSGYVDTVTGTGDAEEGNLLEITGRDRFGQLVDVDARPGVIAGKDLQQIAEQLSTPFVTEWVFENEENRRKMSELKRRIKRLKRFRRRIVEKAFQLSLNDTGQKFAEIEDEQVPVAKLLGHGSDPDGVRFDQAQTKISSAQRNLAQIRSVVFPRVKIEPGEKILEVIVRIAERAGMAVWQTAEGVGIIARPQYDQLPAFKLFYLPLENPDRHLNNVKQASTSWDGSERFRSYTMGTFAPNDDNNAESTQRYRLTETDNGVQLSDRVLYVGGRGSQNRKQAKAELRRDVQRREFEAEEHVYTVEGHRQGDLLWQQDTICSVMDKINGVEGKYYVTRRRFVGDENNGQTTEVTLRRPEIWLP